LDEVVKDDFCFYFQNEQSPCITNICIPVPGKNTCLHSETKTWTKQSTVETVIPVSSGLEYVDP